MGTDTEGMNPAMLRRMEEIKKSVLGRMLDSEAYERLSRVRLVDQALASRTEMYLLQIYQTGKFHNKVTDEQMKETLSLLAEKKNFKISRK